MPSNVCTRNFVHQIHTFGVLYGWMYFKFKAYSSFLLNLRNLFNRQVLFPANCKHGLSVMIVSIWTA